MIRQAVWVVAAWFVLARPAAAEVDFAKEIRPILEQHCLKCHGPDKPKAGLRLDTREELLKGSKINDQVVIPGKAAESLLYQVIILPETDESRMPPEGKPLSKAQTDKIRDWINEGLNWPKDIVLRAPGVPAKPAAAEAGLPITPEEKVAVEKLQKTGALVLRLAQNTNWLRVDFAYAKEVKDEDLALLKDMPNLYELGLAGTTVTDAGLVHLQGLKNLTRLQLQNTKITDAGLVHLKGLEKLVSLNLYGTAVTDAGLEHLKGLTSLRKLYLWQTKVTEAGAKKLAEAPPEVVIDRGYEAAAPETKPEETKKPEADKKP
ncbi:MAG: hypothetical protein NZ700_17110 [Gemmataceae bacterium]|nr:hypothetical protein [Gemmataceae bacterium]MDW8264121.1 c-type cytochrome domain-containing protein [Gemmataceae bacterium]